MIAEVQQNSNVTYRVYDYGRVGADGKPRALHVEKALDVTLRTLPVKHDFGSYLAQCEYFTVDARNGAFEGTADEKSLVSLLITDGEGELICGGETVAVKKGDSFFLPAGSGSYTPYTVPVRPCLQECEIRLWNSKQEDTIVRKQNVLILHC